MAGSSVQRINEIVKALSGITGKSADAEERLANLTKQLLELGNSINAMQGAEGFEELRDSAEQARTVILELGKAINSLDEGDAFKQVFTRMQRYLRGFNAEVAASLDAVYGANPAGANKPLEQTFGALFNNAGVGFYGRSNIGTTDPVEGIKKIIEYLKGIEDFRSVAGPIPQLPTPKAPPATVAPHLADIPEAVQRATQEPEPEIFQNQIDSVKELKQLLADPVLSSGTLFADPGAVQGEGIWLEARKARIQALKEYIQELRKSKEAEEAAARASESAKTAEVDSADILRELNVYSANLLESTKQRTTALTQETDAETRLNDVLRQEIELRKQQAAIPPKDPAAAGLDAYVPPTGKVNVVRGSMEDLERVLGSGTQFSERLATAQKALSDQWSAAGLTLKEYKAELDATTGALKVYADVSANVQGGAYIPQLEGKRLAQSTVDIATGEIITPAIEVERILKSMGAGADAFNKIEAAVTKAGLSMNDFKRDFGETNEGLRKLQFESVGASGAISRQNVILDKSGNIANTVKSKYEGLTSAISNNVSKVLRWGIAVGLVYGTMNKVREAISEMITMQDALADIQIVTGRGSEDLAGALAEVADAAAATGIKLGEAVGVYRQALQAAGRYTDESEKMAKAQTLVADSLVLARLGNLDTSKALDSLVGALRQSNLEIDQGTKLLDSWVATSKAAKVSLDDLSESFAITAAQANAVGVNVDELNGIIGTIAEVTTLSSTEIGNLARTLLSAFEADEAVNALRKHGIVVKDVTGEYRDWNEVMQDISNLFTAGAITEKELSEIGRALGGGARRGPQVVAFIKEYARVNEIAAESADADGEAADALGIKMDTLSNTVNKLQVALSQLAQTAGAEGGLLDFLTSVVDIATAVVGAVDDITARFGELGSVLATLGVASVALKKADIFGRFGASALGQGLTGRIGAIGAPPPLDPTVQQRYNKVLGITPGPIGVTAGQKFIETAKGLAPQLSSVIGTGIGAAAITYMSTDSATRGVGAGIGAAVGSVLGGPVGTGIGIFIGDTIGKQIQQELDATQELRKFEAERERGDERSVTENTEALEKLVEGLRDFGDQIAGRGPIVGGESPIPVWGARTQEQILRAAELRVQELQDLFAERGITPEQAAETDLGRRLAIFQDLINITREQINAVEENTDATREAIDPAAQRRAGIRAEYEPGLDAALNEARTEWIRALSSGDLSRSDYTRRMENRETAPGVLVNIFDLLETELDAFGGKSKSTFEELGVTMTESLDPRTFEYLQDRLAEIASLNTAIADIKNDTTATISQLSYAAELEAQLAMERRLVAEELLALIEEAQAALEVRITPSFTRRPEELTPDIARQAMEVAKANQEMYAQMSNIDPKDFAEMADSFIEVWDTDNKLRELRGVHKIFWDDAVNLALAAAKEIEDAQQEFSVRRLQDVDPSQFGEIQARNRYWIEFLARMQGMTAEQYLADQGYEENLILGPNNVWQKLLTTSEAMAFTLQDILETEKKQLEGMWNIPEGATFWVPLTSLFYQNQDQGGGVPALPPIDEELVERLAELEDALANAGRFAGFEPIEEPMVEEEPSPRYRRQRGRRVEPSPATELIGAQGNQLIEAIEALATKSDQPEKYLESALAAIRTLKETGITDTGEVNVENVDSIGDAIRAGIAATMLPVFQEAFSSTFGDKLDTQQEFSLVEEAISQLLENYTPEDAPTSVTTPRGFSDIIAEPVNIMNQALMLMQNFVERPPLTVSLETGDVTRSIEMTSTILLDGQVLKRWVSNWVATEINRLSRGQGFSGLA